MTYNKQITSPVWAWASVVTRQLLQWGRGISVLSKCHRTPIVEMYVIEAFVFAPPTRRPRVHHRVNPYPGDRRQFVVNLTNVLSEDVC